MSSIRNRRNDLKLYRKTAGSLGQAGTKALVRTFKGRIDKGTSDTVFVDGKIQSSLASILFCSVDEVFESNDLIQDIDGQRYVVSEGEQPDGVSGIKPSSFKAHKEIRLNKSNA
jgi:hypothetical protein